jgi:hypothetical protein
MFYKTGVDITNDKQMFNFLKSHFEYWTMNSWNRACSIANNVKLHRLNLAGDWCVALDLLNRGEYEILNDIIYDWMYNHPGYEVRFNGRSGGYLVLGKTDQYNHVLPEEILECEDYGEYKRYCREYYGSVKANRSELVFYTKLVQDFDKLCDELRDYCNELSKQVFEIVEMQKAVEQFNECYYADLDYLNFSELRCKEDGTAYVGEIFKLQSLAEAFLRIADRTENGFIVKVQDDLSVKLVKNR